MYKKLLDVILNNIIPDTKISIINGNKIFGAAILKKSDFSPVIIGVNNEIKNPLFHGEIVTLNKYFESNYHNIINPSECIFLSTHEPCSLCLSAITWGGFDNFYYYFPYSKTKDEFNIPHDLNILKEVFNIQNGKYSKKNKYWKSFSIINEIKKLEKKEIILEKKMNKINKEYSLLSNLYQKNKNFNKIPLN
tara:strand:+ start:420 stop:995 length:576 start_codon:yes stop_codon:yes gene_type:complete